VNLAGFKSVAAEPVRVNGAFVGLLAGNDAHAEAYDDAFDGLQDGQDPPVVTVCCSDSRVLADHMWANDEPGRVFSCENIGNRVVQRTAGGEAVSGDVAYPVVAADAETVAVVGHTSCGAVTATHDAMAGDPPAAGEQAGIGHCVDLLAERLADGVELLPAELDRPARIDHLVEYNVDRQVRFLLDSDDVPGDVEVVGAVYDFQDTYGGRRGEVHVVNVDGERDPTALRESHPEVADRVSRLWEY
jgi:carbonic anhydrase